MVDDDDALRAAYQSVMEPPDEHVDDATWERLGTGSLDEAERARVADHVVRCGACARIWRGVRALDEARRPSQPPMLRRLLYAASAFAAAAAVVLLALRWFGPDEPSGEAVRGRPTSGATLEVDAAAAPASFSWHTAAERVDGYRVRIFTAAGEPAWTSEVVPAPPLVPKLTLPAGDYRWEVDAVRDGSVVASSRLVPFHVGN